MNRKELIKHCLIEDAIETYPFKDNKCGEIPVIHHKSKIVCSYFLS